MKQAIDDVILRYRSICDGQENIDAVIGVVSGDSQGAGEPMFLRRYSSNVTLIPQNQAELSVKERQTLQGAAICFMKTTLGKLDPQMTRMDVFVGVEELPLSFDLSIPHWWVRARAPKSLDRLACR
jgi:hypothetical protein